VRLAAREMAEMRKRFAALGVSGAENMGETLP